MNGSDGPVAVVRNLSHDYGSVTALADISVDIPMSRLTGLIGPDGVGKSSLLAILAGARKIQHGSVTVLGVDISNASAPSQVCPKIAYMPQGLGKNLYPDLSVRENIEFFARLFGQSHREREWRIKELLESTGLTPFADRPANKLSGGMRQKLGLCCSLIHDPDLLILDEPTTGVDPLSRRQFWNLIGRLRARRPEMSVIVATAYMEEAEHFDWLIAMNEGQILAAGTPSDLKQQTHTESIEDAFVTLLPRPEPAPTEKKNAEIVQPHVISTEPVIVAQNLPCRFGDFTAVHQVNFTIRQGEIFGFVGSNGSGKTTTMKMLTGLLPPTEGEALIFGKRLAADTIESRRRVGYMSQSFSLYSELTVRQNLALHARLFSLPTKFANERIAELVEKCNLAGYLDSLASALPLGIRQRLLVQAVVV